MGIALSRRSFLRLGLATSAALALSGCAAQDGGPRSSTVGGDSSEAGNASAKRQDRDALGSGASAETPKTVVLNSGYEMPTQGLGTYALDYATCTSSIHALAAAGGRLIDTAYMYHNEDAVSYIQSLGIVVEGWYPLGGRGHNDELLADPELTVIAQARGVCASGDPALEPSARHSRHPGIVQPCAH